jgi:F0F1-type ATP synthase epsilon subunit
MANQQLIKVKVSDTDTIIFEGEVERISSFNEVGRFDVYPMHANFISLIRQELTLFQKKVKVKEVKLEQAVMKVKKDIVHIFLGIEAFAIEDEPTPKPPKTSSPSK